ncbi:methyl-accepting chemotaxis protein [Thermatribacter velox]|uniref:Methyl-accepting chemotaxis protein n=1 Tax=Thermatribacter velox TaxID=3039681 RepID=A0ABZ2YDQ5_9BACT
MKRKSSLRGKLLFWFLLFSLLPLCFIGFYGLSSFQKSLLDKTNREISSLVNLGAKSIEVVLKEKIRQAEEGKLSAFNSFWANPSGEATDSLGNRVDFSQYPFFTKTIQQGTANLSNLFMNPGSSRLIYYLATPKLVEDQVIGAMVFEVEGRDIQDLVSGLSIGEGGVFYLVGSDGLVMLHPEEEIAFKANIKDLLGSQSEAFFSNDVGVLQINSGDAASLLAFALSPTSGWRVVAEVPVASVYQDVFAMRKMVILVIIAVAILISVLATIIVGRVTGNLRKITYLVQEVAQGNLKIDTGFLETIQRKLHDEVGVLAGAFLKMVQSIKGIVGETLNASSLLFNSAKELATSVQEVSKATQEIAQTISQVAEGSNHQSEELGAVEQEVSGIAQKADVLLETTERNVEAVRNIRSHMEENLAAMVAIEDALRRTADEAQNDKREAERGKELLRGLSGNIQTISSAAQEVAEAVRTLSARSEEISSIVGIITGIAEQTNLLALNAAIEAARAGDAGRGFAVVAEEVRKLAEESSRAADQIAYLIEEVRKDMLKVSSSMSEAQNEVQKGVEQQKEVNQNFEAIIASVERTLSEIDALSESLNRAKVLLSRTSEEAEVIANLSEENSRSLGEMTASIKSITEKIASVASIAEENAASSEEVSASTEEQNASLEEITSATETLVKLAEDLKSKIAIFQV